MNHRQDTNQGRAKALPTEKAAPCWEPLEQHIGERCSEWMWMYRDRGLEFYKHRETRRYLILDRAGIAWRYREVDGMLVPGEFDVEHARVTFGYSTESDNG